jgi:hypothetical protein
VTELAAEGELPLERLASLIQLIGYSTVYLGIALGLDPSPISAIGCAQGQDRVAGPRREAGISGARQAALARLHPPAQGPRASLGVARGHRGHRRLVFALAGVSLAVITGNGAWDGAGSIATGVLLCLVAVVLAAEMKSLLIGQSASAEAERAIVAALEDGP